MMFNVELPPDSSWKWSTGITTEDQNEIQRLEKRIKVLEDKIKRLDYLVQKIESYAGTIEAIIKDARAEIA